MRHIMLIDSEKCIDCRACIMACQQKNSVPPGYSRNGVRKAFDSNSRSGAHFQPWACMHCENPPCVRSCPTLATYKDVTGVVLIDGERCIGCGNCIDTCPYDARFRHPLTGIADKCDYCLSAGGEPACVAACPVQCRYFGDADDPKSHVSQLLATRKIVHVAPEGSFIQPTLAYLNSTLPSALPAVSDKPDSGKKLGFLAEGLSWAGAGVLAALGGVWIRQAVRPSTREEEKISQEEKK